MNDEEVIQTAYISRIWFEQFSTVDFYLLWKKTAALLYVIQDRNITKGIFFVFGSINFLESSCDRFYLHFLDLLRLDGYHHVGR